MHWLLALAAGFGSGGFSPSTCTLEGRTLHFYVPPPPNHQPNASFPVATCLMHALMHAQCVPALSPEELVDLGAVWAGHKGSKPRRVTQTTAVQPGDYLRAHTAPRRYAVTASDVAVVHSGPDFTVVNKPRGVPVHPTVDNAKENVLSIINPDGREFPYLAAPHRLDVETEGLLVLATTPAAAARIGAAFRPREEPLRRASSTFQRARKVYRALVTPSAHLIPGSVLHHLQVKAKGAPKRFLPVFPGQPVAPGTLRCALKILSVSTPHLVPDSALPGGTGFAATLLQEVRCELLTGRTHQIRGQLAAVGASIYGDNMYCGQREEGILAPSWSHSPHLALQSCELELSEESFHCQLPRAWWSDAFLSAPGSDASMDVHTQIPAQISPGKSDSY